MNLFDVNPSTKEIKVDTDGLKTLLNSIGDGVSKIVIEPFFNEIRICFNTPTNNAISVLDWSNLDDILTDLNKASDNLFTYSIEPDFDKAELAINNSIGKLIE